MKKAPYDPKWSVRQAIQTQVEREDAFNWALKPPREAELPRMVETPQMSQTALHVLFNELKKEPHRWIP